MKEIQKKTLNKINIRENLSKVINDIQKVDEAMDLIMNNREVVTKYKLCKSKNNQFIILKYF